VKTRSHAYPEHADYRDTGCDLHDRCLTCPFEHCRYDAHSIHGQLTRDRVIAALVRSANVDYIAQEAGISRRQAFRIIHDLKETPMSQETV
jgi:hypothetical protein